MIQLIWLLVVTLLKVFKSLIKRALEILRQLIIIIIIIGRESFLLLWKFSWKTLRSLKPVTVLKLQSVCYLLIICQNNQDISSVDLPYRLRTRSHHRRRIIDLIISSISGDKILVGPAVRNGSVALFVQNKQTNCLGNSRKSAQLQKTVRVNTEAAELHKDRMNDGCGFPTIRHNDWVFNLSCISLNTV